MDEETERLTIQLQLEDLDVIVASSKGKAREGSLSDGDVALQLYRHTLETAATIISDRQMTRSIACAVQSDGHALLENAEQESRATTDREIAHSLLNDREQPSIRTPTTQAESTPIDDELLEKLTALYVFQPDETYQGVEDGQEAEASSSAAKRGFRPLDIDRRCEACRQVKRFFDVARAPCRHEYCRDCLGDLFQASMTDETLFPPRCCRQPIPIDSVRIFLVSQLVRSFEKRKMELETPNRTYCCSRTCSAFIPAESITSETAVCQDCGTRTCTTCKGAAHSGDCPNDEALQQLLQTASTQGWQRCYACSRVVELDLGCNHMICRCGAHFCYMCGEPWKTCHCEQWEERRLFARANQVVDRQPDGNRNNVEPNEEDSAAAAAAAAAAAPREVRLAAAVQNLRDNHECTHEQWRFVSGPYQCEECRHHLPQYIFECRQCQLRTCNRCRRNRL